MSAAPRARPVLDVWVPGKPEPQGSTQAFVPTTKGGAVIRKNGRIIVNITSDNPNVKKWRKATGTIAAAALARDAGTALPPAPVDKPVSFVLRAVFCLERPEDQYRTGGNAHLIRDGARAWPAVLPDVDKLLRATLDALTGIVYVDDSQVTDVSGAKRYAVPTRSSPNVGTRIRVDRLLVETAVDLPPELRERPQQQTSLLVP